MTKSEATDFNDLHRLEGLHVVREQLFAAYEAFLNSPPLAHNDNEIMQAVRSEKPLKFDLMNYSLNGASSDMEEKMLDEKFVLDKLALMGQMTVFFAAPNMGKTIAAIALLIQSLKVKRVVGTDVFYINADDHYSGLVTKLKLAEQHGFNMLAPSHNGFKNEMLVSSMVEMVRTGSASGKVVFTDTLKKFTDVMDKTKSTAFGKCARDFVQQGGTLIMLAHVNKHKNQEGKSVYAGTTDIVDDCDCAYMVEQVDETELTRTIRFENIKSRGNVEREAIYEYSIELGMKYIERVESFRKVSTEEAMAIEKDRIMKDLVERHEDAAKAIKEALECRMGECNKTELLSTAYKVSGISKQKLAKALDFHTGEDLNNHKYWQLEVGRNNAHIYHLNRVLI